MSIPFEEFYLIFFLFFIIFIIEKNNLLQCRKRKDNSIMSRQKKTNNELINTENNPSPFPGATGSVQHKRGRPKGSKNSVKTQRPDKRLNIPQGENTKIINYALALSVLPKIDVNNLQQVEQRITDFIRISAEHDCKLAIASLAVAFGIDRVTLFNWITERTGTIKNRECLNAIKRIYAVINLQYEQMMNDGKINPVSGIFLLKNNMGYKDTTDHIITANNDNMPTITDIENRAGLLD